MEQMNNLILKHSLPLSCISSTQRWLQHSQRSNSLLSPGETPQTRAPGLHARLLAGQTGTVSGQTIQPLRRPHSADAHPELRRVSQTLSSTRREKPTFVFRPSTDTHKHMDLYTNENTGCKTKLMLSMLWNALIFCFILLNISFDIVPWLKDHSWRNTGLDYF